MKKKIAIIAGLALIPILGAVALYGRPLERATALKDRAIERATDGLITKQLEKILEKVNSK